MPFFGKTGNIRAETHIERSVFVAALCSLLSIQSPAQQMQPAKRDRITDTVVAGREFAAGHRHRLLFGNNYRDAWMAAVNVQVRHATVVDGHDVPGSPFLQMPYTFSGFQPGGVFFAAPVNKPYCIALPDIAKGTFFQDMAHDAVSAYHPYAALTLPLLAHTAGIAQANVQEVKLMLENIEQRTLQDRGGLYFLWTEARVPPNTLSTAQLLQQLAASPECRIDQKSYVTARLLDMLLGDFTSYEEKVRWQPMNRDGYIVYRPVALLSDKAYANFDGLLTRIVCNALDLSQLQHFGDKISDLQGLNSENIFLDRRLTNALTAEDWADAAAALQRSLTDNVLQAALNNMPPTQGNLYKAQLLNALQQRRNDIANYARQYYRFLAYKTDVPGTKADERFVVERLSDGKTRISIFRKDVQQTPEYQRTFLPRETKEINIYGMGGKDLYQVQGVANRGIMVRIIGGTQEDSLIDLSHVKGPGHKTQFYDNGSNTIVPSTETKVHISSDNNQYDIRDAARDKRGFIPMAGYETLYEFYIGLGYEFKKHQWHKRPFASDHVLGARYSINEMSLSLLYNGMVNDIVGKWNLVLNAGYDMIRDVNYFGAGNDTRLHSRHWPYYMLFTRDLYARLGLDRVIDSIHDFRLLLVYDRTKVVRDRDHYISEPAEAGNRSTLGWKDFGGLEGTYELTKIDDPSFVMRGYHVLADVQWVENLANTARTVTNYQLSGGAFIPLASSLSLVLKAGGATETGKPEFYQLNNIGGMYNLRGYRRYRFYGRTAFYNQNELRWTQNVHSYIMNGKWGLMAFYDNGRVWQPGEKSNTWHAGFGAGFMIEPFNKLSFVLSYGHSREDNVVNVHVGRYF